MSEITINALLRSKPGVEEQLFEEMKKALAPSRSEEGCINYDLHRSKEDSRLFVFYETWANQDALNSHVNSAHYQAYREATAPLVETREVHILEKVK